MTIRILSLAEADLLNGFRFYERQSSGVGLYFLESLTSDIESLRLYAGIHRKVLAIIECFRSDFLLPFITICTRTRSGFGAFWIADAIRIGSSFG